MYDQAILPADSPNSLITAGFCRTCRRDHALGAGPAHDVCLQLIHHFLQYETIDLDSGPDFDPQLSTAPLFGQARGKMFGTLVGRHRDGATVVLKAFSGQYNGLWHVPGWAPPLFDLQEFHAVNTPGEKAIKALGKELAAAEPHSLQWQAIRHRRRRLSRELMGRLHDLYRLTNFTGKTVTLAEAFTGAGGIPTGTGDCCAPKLLQQAADLGITPLGIAEFFWGKTNKSATRHHGRFYPACREKCRPILGHLLCGIDQGDSDD